MGSFDSAPRESLSRNGPKASKSDVATTIEGDTEEDETETDTATTEPEGDGNGNGDGDRDGDGDAGDGDGDGDGIGCSDGDSGVEPPDNDDWLAPGNDPQPHGGFVPNLDLPNPSECDVFMQDCTPGEKCLSM